jgi:hypothetical protein
MIDVWFSHYSLHGGIHVPGLEFVAAVRLPESFQIVARHLSFASVF